jgi:hypothetical protein
MCIYISTLILYVHILTNSIAKDKKLKTMPPSGNRTHDILFSRRTRCHAAVASANAFIPFTASGFGMPICWFHQGCQMGYFQTKNPNLGNFWNVSSWKMLVNVIAIWSILLPFCIFYDHLIYFVVILVYFPPFGMLYQEKSGNPGFRCSVIRNLSTEYAVTLHRIRVARFFLTLHTYTKLGKIHIRNDQKVYEMVIKYIKMFHSKGYQNTHTKIWSLGMKIYHMATLDRIRIRRICIIIHGLSGKSMFRCVSYIFI